MATRVKEEEKTKTETYQYVEVEEEVESLTEDANAVEIKEEEKPKNIPERAKIVNLIGIGANAENASYEAINQKQDLEFQEIDMSADCSEDGDKDVSNLVGIGAAGKDAKVKIEGGETKMKYGGIKLS